MIKWRSGLAGFAGNSKRLIKGVFSYVYTVTSVSIEPPNLTVGFMSIIQETGKGALSIITSDGVGVLSEIEQSNGLLSIIQSNGKGVSSAITETGQGVDSQ